jgi:hypothetical protein
MYERIVFGLVGLLLVLTIASGALALRSAQESRWNREVLCLGILGNLQNTAHADSRVVELCASVGVEASYAREGR